MTPVRFASLVGSAALALGLTGPVASEESEIDLLTGLKVADDWELVRNNCIACHSLKLVTQQRGDAQKWLKLIRWMQKTQNLWQFDPDTEARIIAYLAENYPPAEHGRRAAVPDELLPPNPYAGSAPD